mmetsp:Transcript_94474/g.272108  ORF Transcript_94474/g.272108 Transcript_94474/m.272108 type:complete len:235 (+) Transcript_94474:922-1626(+)
MRAAVVLVDEGLLVVIEAPRHEQQYDPQDENRDPVAPGIVQARRFVKEGHHDVHRLGRALAFRDGALERVVALLEARLAPGDHPCDEGHGHQEFLCVEEKEEADAQVVQLHAVVDARPEQQPAQAPSHAGADPHVAPHLPQRRELDRGHDAEAQAQLDRLAIVLVVGGVQDVARRVQLEERLRTQGVAAGVVCHLPLPDVAASAHRGPDQHKEGEQGDRRGEHDNHQIDDVLIP